MTAFQQMLAAGEFENNTQSDYLQYLRGKRRREAVDDPWKQKYYEEYWGQKKDDSETQMFDSIVNSNKPPSPFSFLLHDCEEKAIGNLMIWWSNHLLTYKKNKIGLQNHELN